MKLLLISLIATITLCLQAPAFAYQEEGPYVSIGLGALHGKVGESTDLSQPFSPPNIYIDNSKEETNAYYTFGVGYSFNWTNSINWQPGIEYYQFAGLPTKGAFNDGDESSANYSYRTRSLGYWLTNTFHFDIFTGSLTPVQPYVTFLLGWARNNSYDYQASGQPNLIAPAFDSHTNNEFAYGVDAGFSYQVSQLQVVSFGVNYWQLGQSSMGKMLPSSPATNSESKLENNNLQLLGANLTYTLQF